MRIVIVLATVIVLAAATAPSASAQTCGDANGDGAVTVTDGVQALRAAAGLSSICDEGCDVDGSGSVTVTDGVNILRGAAGLSFAAACDFTGQEANEVVNPSLSVFDGISKIPAFGSGASAAGRIDCENDGTLETTGNTAQSIATFTNCRIGGVLLDGTIGRIVLGNGIVVGFQDYKTTRIKSGKSLTFSGQLGVLTGTEGKRLSGELTVVSSERGTFTMRFERILIVKDGTVRDGALIYDLTEADGGTIEAIRITFDESDELVVTVRRRNQQVKQFILDRATRLLRPPL